MHYFSSYRRIHSRDTTVYGLSKKLCVELIWFYLIYKYLLLFTFVVLSPPFIKVVKTEIEVVLMVQFPYI